MPQPAVDAISALNPYQGGNQNLWTLHTLNNIDKHRLILTVGIRATGHTILPEMERALLAIARMHNPGSDPNPRWKGGIFGFGPNGRNPILKKGDVLLTVRAEETRDDMNFAIDVAFAESGIPMGIGVWRTLSLIHKEVSMVCSNFAQYL